MECVAKVEEVFSKVRMYKPDLVILDCLLSGIYGAAMCRQLKHYADTKHFPIITFSVHPATEDAAKKAGAECFISKPFAVDKLLERIQEHSP